MAAIVVIVGAVAFVQQQQRVAEELAAAEDGYESSASALNTSIGAAERVLKESEGAVLDETSRQFLETEIAEAADAVAETIDLKDAELLATQTSRFDDARTELDNAALRVDESVAALADLVSAREKTTAVIATAQQELPIAEKLLADSDGKVNNALLRDQLAAAIETLRTLVGKDPTVLDTVGLNALDEDLTQARQVKDLAVEKVINDQAAWQTSTEEAAAAAALLDPASYASISSRDWQLVERDPAAHMGKKYVIFGRVTQFDSNTGRDTFRASTDGQKKSRSYDYEINTMVIGTEELLANVVQGDLAKLYVSVMGPYSYETTMGGKLSVPMIRANIVEVYGSA